MEIFGWISIIPSNGTLFDEHVEPTSHFTRIWSSLRHCIIGICEGAAGVSKPVGQKRLREEEEQEEDQATKSTKMDDSSLEATAFDSKNVVSMKEEHSWIKDKNKSIGKVWVVCSSHWLIMAVNNKKKRDSNYNDCDNINSNIMTLIVMIMVLLSALLLLLLLVVSLLLILSLFFNYYYLLSSLILRRFIFLSVLSFVFISKISSSSAFQVHMKKLSFLLTPFR